MKKWSLAAAVILSMTGCATAVSQQPMAQHTPQKKTAAKPHSTISASQPAKHQATQHKTAHASVNPSAPVSETPPVSTTLKDSFFWDSHPKTALTASKSVQHTTKTKAMVTAPTDQPPKKHAAAAAPAQTQPSQQLWKRFNAFLNEPTAVSPGITAGAPSGYGANWGQAFFAIAGGTRTPTSSRLDGSAIYGMGFGDASKILGVEVDAAIISINPYDGGFGEDGEVGIKFHKILPGNMSVAVGAQNPVRWGSAKNIPESYYTSLTKIFLMHPTSQENVMPLFVTLGAGTGSFQSATGNSTGRDATGIFGAVSWHFVRRASVTLDYTSQLLNAGFSFVPFNTLPVSVSITATDLAHRVTSQQAFTVAAGYLINF